MKQFPSVILAFFIIMLTAACSAKTAPAAVAQAPAVTITPVTIATTAPTLTQTPTAVPTMTLEASLTPAPSPTATPVLPSPTPTIGYAQECIEISDQLPADLDANGALMLYGGRYASDWNRTMFHFDLMSQRRSPLPYSSSGDALSPDGKWLAYLSVGLDEKGFWRDFLLRVTNAEGRHVDMSYWGLNWQELVGWVDEEHVLLKVPGYPGGDYIILNPFTREKTVIDFPLPETSAKGLFNPPNPRYANRQLSHWMISSINAISIYQLADQHEWTERMTSRWQGSILSSPKWSPDGRFLKMMYGVPQTSPRRIDWRVMRIDQDGSVAPLTDIVGEGEKLSWSPDSRYLAGWVQLDPNTTGYPFPNDLVLIDVEKPQVTDLCFQNAVTTTGWVENTAPVWSPDGRYLALAVSRIEQRANSRYTSEILIWDTVIIDLKARRGYLLAKDARPQVWMRKP